MSLVELFKVQNIHIVAKKIKKEIFNKHEVDFLPKKKYLTKY